MPNISNTIEINCTPEALYAYLAQPWLWHEWHPNSKGATAESKHLAVGDTFTEQFEAQPVSFLPLRIRREFHYTVVHEEPCLFRELSATGKGVKIRFRYHFEPNGTGAKFTRILDYELSGLLRLLGPLFRQQNIKNSNLAMVNLKRRMDPGSSPG